MLQSSFLMLCYSIVARSETMNFILPKLKTNSSNTLEETQKLHDLIDELFLKEELNKGKGYASAVNDGYKRSLAPVLDAHVTTFLTALTPAFSFP